MVFATGGEPAERVHQMLAGDRRNQPAGFVVLLDGGKKPVVGMFVGDTLRDLQDFRVRQGFEPFLDVHSLAGERLVPRSRREAIPFAYEMQPVRADRIEHVDNQAPELGLDGSGGWHRETRSGGEAQILVKPAHRRTSIGFCS
jgi:hypothetical protein